MDSITIVNSVTPPAFVIFNVLVFLFTPLLGSLDPIVFEFEGEIILYFLRAYFKRCDERVSQNESLKCQGRSW